MPFSYFDKGFANFYFWCLPKEFVFKIFFSQSMPKNKQIFLTYFQFHFLFWWIITFTFLDSLFTFTFKNALAGGISPGTTVLAVRRELAPCSAGILFCICVCISYLQLYFVFAFVFVLVFVFAFAFVLVFLFYLSNTFSWITLLSQPSVD